MFPERGELYRDAVQQLSVPVEKRGYFPMLASNPRPIQRRVKKASR
jgi:hypothetical protein